MIKENVLVLIDVGIVSTNNVIIKLEKPN